MTLRKNELHAYTQLAESAVTDYYANATLPKDDAQHAAKNILRKLSYSKSGYFFVTNFEGTMVAHGANSALEGRNLWNLKSKDGRLVTQDIIEVASNGAGFTEYMWDKPGSEEPIAKISYVQALEKWNWILGTGLYIDDIAAVHDRLNNQLDANLRQNIWVFLGLSSGALLFAALLFGSLSLKEGGQYRPKTEGVV